MSFAYARPETINAAHALAAIGGRILAGGQSLMPLVNRGDIEPGLLVDINRIPGLGEIRLVSDVVEIGALARLETVRQHPLVREHLPLLAAALEWVANPAIRRRGTLVGNLVHAAPGTETAAVAALHVAEFALSSETGLARKPAVCAVDGGLVIAVRIPVSPKGSCAGFHEVQRRFGHLGLVGAGVLIMPEGQAKAVVSGFLDRPLLLPEVGEALRQGLHGLTDLRAAFALDSEGLTARSDLHGDAAYRRDVAPVVLHRALQQALDRRERA